MPSSQAPASPPPDESAKPGAALQRSTGEAALIRSLSKLDEVLTGLITQQLPAALAQALTVALSQAPNDEKACGRCQLRRAEWDALNADVIAFAFEQARQEAGIEPGDPATAELDPLKYIPEALHFDPADPLGKTGRLPMTFPVVTTIGGTDLCAMDVREIAEANLAARLAQPDDGQARQEQAARRELLIAPAGMNARTAAQLAVQGIPTE
jgi:hypothetical protein